jgi:hypothetical protein
MVVHLYKLKSGPKKFKAVFIDDKTKKKVKSVSFGARGYEDYTIHKDPERYKSYKARHSTTENWTRSGKHTTGFWSRWLLWSDPSFAKAVKITEGKLGEKIVYKH